MNFSRLIKIQEFLAKKVILEDKFDNIFEIKTVGGIDVHYKKNGAVVGFCIHSFPENVLIIKKVKFLLIKNIFPYRSGFLCFREGIPIVEFLKREKFIPDVLLINGHGIAHPKKMGVASFVGVKLDIPTIGCAKQILYGNLASRPGEKKSEYSYIYDEKNKKEIIAAAVRTKTNVKEIIVSSGHRISLPFAIEVVLKTSKYRFPEPLRQAHMLAKNFVNNNPL